MRGLYVLLASAVMATTLLVVAAGASAFPSMTQKEEFLAVAYSPSLARVDIEDAPGTFWMGASTLGRAQTGAYQACVDEGRNNPQDYNYDCKGVAWVQNGYLGFAGEAVTGTAGETDEAYEPVWGWAARRTYQGAEKEALRLCEAKGPQYGNCQPLTISTDKPFGRPFRGGPWHTGPM